MYLFLLNFQTGIRVSTNYKVYLPQIWCVWIHTETRLTLRATSEYCQWKDIHIHLVLVYNIAVFIDRTFNLSVSITFAFGRNKRIHLRKKCNWIFSLPFHPQCNDHFDEKCPCKNLKCPKSIDSRWYSATNITQIRRWRLVAYLHAEQKFGSDCVQRCAGAIAWATRNAQQSSTRRKGLENPFRKTNYQPIYVHTLIALHERGQKRWRSSLIVFHINCFFFKWKIIRKRL